MAFLRQAVTKKGITTAEIGTRLGIDRSAVKRRLAGGDPLTLDDLVLLTRVLELTPAQLGLAEPVEPVSPPVDAP